MSDWSGYIVNLMNPAMAGAAIYGYTDGGETAPWASSDCAELRSITTKDIQELLATDRSKLFAEGVTLGGCKCALVRDGLKDENAPFIDLRTKGCDPASICVGRTHQAIIIVKGKKETHAGAVNVACTKMTEYLRKCNY